MKLSETNALFEVIQGSFNIPPPLKWQKFKVPGLRPLDPHRASPWSHGGSPGIPWALPPEPHRGGFHKELSLH